MTDLSDLEHDSNQDGPSTIGLAPVLPPSLTDKAMDREDRREALRERRTREGEPPIPQTHEAMLAARYRMRTPEDEAKLAARQAEWLSPDNPVLWSRLDGGDTDDD